MSKKKMAKKPRIIPNKVPYVQAAAFCEQVLEDKDGISSLIRIFDRISVPGPVSAPGVDLRPGVFVKVFVMLKSGSVKGKRKIRIVPKSPKGDVGSAAEADVVFEGEEHGVNIQAQLNIPVQGEGLYWFDVFVGDDLVTRMPLRISYLKPPESTPEARKSP